MEKATHITWKYQNNKLYRENPEGFSWGGDTSTPVRNKNHADIRLLLATLEAVVNSFKIQGEMILNLGNQSLVKLLVRTK